MEVYKNYSKIVIKLDNVDETVVTLNLWKCFAVKNSNITTYSLSDDYTDNAYENSSGKLAKESDYIKFLSYLKIDTTQKNWWTRCGQVISEEERVDAFGDIYSVYKFHYLITTSEGDILNILPFDPIDFYLKE